MWTFRDDDFAQLPAHPQDDPKNYNKSIPLPEFVTLPEQVETITAIGLNLLTFNKLINSH